MAGNPITNAISGVGTFLGLPDLGIGAAGGNGAPGLLQGVNPETYAGVGTTNPTSKTAAILPATTPQQAAVLGAQTAPTTPGVQPSGSTPPGAVTTPATNPNQAVIQQLLSQAGGLVNQINGLYNQIYGPGGNYGQGLENSENQIESGYVPQYQNNALQAQQLGQALDFNMLSRGTGVSSFAGQQQQNLANNAQNQAGQIAASEQKDLNNLATSAAQNKQTSLAQQQAANQELALYNQTAPQDTTGSANYQLGSFISNLLSNTIPGLQSQIAGNQPSGALATALQTAAPSQIYNPNTLSQQLNSLNQSSIPNYLQSALANSAITANTQNPGDYNYWLNYAKNLANPIST